MKTKTTKKIDFQFGLVIGNWGLVLKVEKQGITLEWGKLWKRQKKK